MTKTELLQYIQHLVDEYGTQKDLAEKLGVSTAYLSDVLQGKREPAGKMLEALGIERVVTYRKVGK